MIPDQIGGKASNEDRPHVGFFRRNIFISNNMADYTWHSRNDRKALWDIIVCNITVWSAVFDFALYSVLPLPPIPKITPLRVAQNWH